MTVFKYNYSNISTNTTTIVARGKGTLHSIVINTSGASSNTCTIYDSTTGSGTKIATIDTAGNTGTIIYDVYFTNGLTIVTATGTPADITVTYIQ